MHVVVHCDAPMPAANNNLKGGAMIKIFLLAAVVLTFVVNVPGAFSAVIGFSPNGLINVAAGNTYNIGVAISGLGPGEIVSAFDLGVRYDQTLLQPVNVTFGPWLGDPSLLDVFEWSSTTLLGLIDIAAVSLLPDSQLQSNQAPANGNLNLATLSFNSVANGTTSLAFDLSPGQQVIGLSNQPMNFSTVPVPAAFMLFGSGVAALLPFIRRTRCSRT